MARPGGTIGHSLWPASGRLHPSLRERPNRSPARTERTLDQPAGGRGPGARDTCRWDKMSTVVFIAGELGGCCDRSKVIISIVVDSLR